MSKTTKPIIVEQNFSVGKERLWRAITKPEEMRIWFFSALQNFTPQVGFTTEFEVYSDDRKFTHVWKIIDVEPHSRITYDWRYKEYDGSAIVTFELTERDNMTKLIVSNLGLDSFPSEIPEFKRESCEQGWQYFIQKELKKYLDNLA